MKAPSSSRHALAMTVELGGRRAASARVELFDEPGDARVARVALCGWIDRAAERRLERALEALAPREISKVVLDCSRVSRLERPEAARLVEAVSRFEGNPQAIE